MKYLMRFNESLDSDDMTEDLLDFCEGNLAYVIDDGLEVRVSRGITQSAIDKNCKYHRYMIYINRGHLDDFDYSDIKDSFIPFMIRFTKYLKENNLKISDIKFYFWKLDKGGNRKFVNDKIKVSVRKIIMDNISISKQVLEALEHMNYIAIEVES